jgi:putative ABC transport system substrate-binding protein
VNRRAFITLLGGAAGAWPLAARAQAKRARIGWFAVAPHPYIDGFRRGLRELGWIEGENLVIETVYADGHPERLPGLAAVLARVPCDLVVATPSKRRVQLFNRFPSSAFPATWAWAQASHGRRAT